jgi:hypothetical protein
MKRLSRARFVVLGLGLSVAAVAGGLAACSSTSASSGMVSGPASCANNELPVAFSPMYSAYDGIHEFEIPAIVTGVSSGVTWSASDNTLVQLAPDKMTGGVLIVIQGAGMVTIVATAGGKCGSSYLTIRQAASGEWDIGNARYNNGKALEFDGGDAAGIKSDGGTACTNCHGPTATTNIFRDIAHTPEQTGGFTDQELIDIVVNGNVPGWAADGGMSPEAGYFDPTIVPYSVWHTFHRWSDITASEQIGMVTYLRSLTPTTQTGSANFGGVDGG